MGKKVEWNTLPVPWGMTPDQALDEAETFGRFHGYSRWKPKFWFMKWAVVVREYDEDD